MARKAKRSRRRRFTGWNATNLLEGYLQASILTEVAFRTTPQGFLFGVPGPSLYLAGPGQGTSAVSLKELIDGIMSGGTIQGHAKTEVQYVMDNIRSGWVEGAIKSVGLGIGFRVGKKLLAKPRRATNRFIKQLGMGTVVRV